MSSGWLSYELDKVRAFDLVLASPYAAVSGCAVILVFCVRRRPIFVAGSLRMAATHGEYSWSGSVFWIIFRLERLPIF